MNFINKYIEAYIEAYKPASVIGV